MEDLELYERAKKESKLELVFISIYLFILQSIHCLSLSILPHPLDITGSSGHSLDGVLVCYSMV